MDRIVELDSVYFGYNRVPVLEDVSFEVTRGDFWGILGANGSGKSTLIRLMLNILKPTSGRVFIYGKDAAGFREWGKMGYVAQRPLYLNQGFPATVEEIVKSNLFPLVGLFRPISKEHKKKVTEVLEMVGMQAYSKRTIGSLSGGQHQKVLIAKALVSSPEVLFLDEPMEGIDLESQRELYGLLKRLNSDMGMTIVMISHDIAAVAERTHKVAVLKNRRLVVQKLDPGIDSDKLFRIIYQQAI